MKKPFIKIDAGNFEISGFQVYPTEGYKFPKNETTGKAFPYCCEFHQSIYEWLKKKYKGKEYQDLPDKVLNQLSFTEHCITQNINKPNWYKAITDYIEYNYFSFGEPLPQYAVNVYLRNVQSIIEGTDLNIEIDKRQKLLEFIEHYYQPDKQPDFDLNVLYSTYQEWLQIFPFGLNSYFGTLKQHFEKQLPFITGTPEENIYLGWVKVKVHTKESLIEALKGLTKELISKIKAPELIEKGIISDINKHRLELANESLKLGTAQLIKNFSEGELQYINMLKEWLQLHKNYFNEIAPIVQPFKPLQIGTQPEQQAPTISKTKQIIIEELETIDKNNGWQYAFSSETDKDIFIELLTLYFELQPYKIPTQTIKLKRNCKTRLASVLNNIYKQLGQTELKSNTAFFTLVRVLNHFESYTDLEIYKAITR